MSGRDLSLDEDYSYFSWRSLMKNATPVLGASRKNTRVLNAKRTHSSAAQARARLQSQFAPSSEIAAKSASQPSSALSEGRARGQDIAQSPVSVASLLKTASFATPQFDAADKHMKSVREMAVEDMSPLNAEQIRRLSIDHAILISMLKRIDTAALAAMLGMPTDNVRKALSGVEEALRAPEWDRVIEIMGIDPETARLNRSMPHFIHVTPATLDAFKALESVFLNMRAARMSFKEGLIARLRNKQPRVAVMQNDHLRIVLIEHEGVRAINAINGVDWARGSEQASLVKSVFSRDRFIAGDLTAIEFDTLFAGDRRIDWNYVELVARANRVSMEDIVSYIQSVGEQKSHEAQTYLKVVNAN